MKTFYKVLGTLLVTGAAVISGIMFAAVIIVHGLTVTLGMLFISIVLTIAGIVIFNMGVE